MYVIIDREWRTLCSVCSAGGRGGAWNNPLTDQMDL